MDQLPSIESRAPARGTWIEIVIGIAKLSSRKKSWPKYFSVHKSRENMQQATVYGQIDGDKKTETKLTDLVGMTRFFLGRA